ncbi:hypothetical protein GQ600_18748 [Phytophthora cactorum]|nr:hypothetical protein GQ600_18748 [Phytophthora cactorum]
MQTGRRTVRRLAMICLLPWLLMLTPVNCVPLTGRGRQQQRLQRLRFRRPRRQRQRRQRLRTLHR